MSYHLAVVGLAVVGAECQDNAEGGSVPTYQYTCTECGEPLEAVQKFSDDPLTVCPVCGGKLRKVFSAVGIVFKGSGFYRTDSRKASADVAASAAKANGSGPASADSGSGSSSGESSGKSGESSGKSGESSGQPGKSGESSGKSGESSGKSSAGEKKSESSGASSASSSGTKVA
jgi:putative FmdB family regulatory protein